MCFRKVTVVRLLFITCAVIVPAVFLVGMIYSEDHQMVHVLFVAPLHITINEQANDDNDNGKVRFVAAGVAANSHRSPFLMSINTNNGTQNNSQQLNDKSGDKSNRRTAITFRPHRAAVNQRVIQEKKNTQIKDIQRRIREQDIVKEQAICKVYLEDGQRERAVTYNVLENPIGEQLVTMVTQMTGERFSMLDHIAQHWHGSISVALYTTEAGYKEFRELVKQSTSLSNRTNIYIHVVYAEGEHYPINFLRNVALQFDTKSKYVFLNDIDFVPSANLEEMISVYHKRNAIFQTLALRPVGLIIPAFEIQKKFIPAPVNKIELIKMLQSKQVIIIGQKRKLVWHQVTDYQRWLTAQDVYEIPWTEYFEPYFVIDRSQVPRYNQQFVGRAYDKSTHAMQLYYLNFKFIVCPHTFVVHLPHDVDRPAKLYYQTCANKEYIKLRNLLQISSPFKHLRKQGLPHPYVAKDLTNWYRSSN